MQPDLAGPPVAPANAVVPRSLVVHCSPVVPRSPVVLRGPVPLPDGSDRCVRFGTYPECPLCGGSLHAEHAHFKCRSCGWRDSCCD